ncbi:hypothetical protein R1flu_013800 [Riccia fluitans]|uniref:Uncharacterized protein n=1 Tax=Riccia fluitans TaxID=41844 RepID=A0ABD1YFE4_9MARC
MGSLPAGWSTNPPCEKKVLRRSTSSMTRSQVHRFWRAKHSQSREHLKDAQRALALARNQSIISETSEVGRDDYCYRDIHNQRAEV